MQAGYDAEKLRTDEVRQDYIARPGISIRDKPVVNATVRTSFA